MPLCVRLPLQRRRWCIGPIAWRQTCPPFYSMQHTDATVTQRQQPQYLQKKGRTLQVFDDVPLLPVALISAYLSCCKIGKERAHERKYDTRLHHTLDVQYYTTSVHQTYVLMYA